MNKLNNSKIIFSLGSNLGDRANNLQQAEKSLQEKLELKNLKISEIYENKALLKPDAPKEWDLDFFNIAISADINLEKFPPLKILEIIKEIETKMGREHKKIWAPRQIDIDILIIENIKVNIGQKLQIPHKELLNRDFFIKPLREIEPEIKIS